MVEDKSLLWTKLKPIVLFMWIYISSMFSVCGFIWTKFKSRRVSTISAVYLNLHIFYSDISEDLAVVHVPH